jgi:hypothetical protein
MVAQQSGIAPASLKIKQAVAGSLATFSKGKDGLRKRQI